MVLDRRAAAGDLVGELGRGEHLRRGQAVLAVDPPALAHADRRAGGDEHRALEAGDAVAQEAEVLVRLAPALQLGGGERVGIGRVDAGDPRHEAHHDALLRRAVDRALQARQAVRALVDRLADQPPQRLLGRHPRDVHAGEPEHRRERLRPPVRRVVRRAGQVADVRVPAGVDHDPRADRPDAALRRELHRVDAAVGVAPGREGEAVQQQPHAGLGGQRLPHALERLRVVGDAGARAVGVRPLEARVLRAEPGDHVVGDAGDHLVRDRARRVERVEGVEDARRRAAEEAEPVHEQRVRPGAGRGDGRGRAGRSGADHEDVDALVASAHLCNYTLI